MLRNTKEFNMSSPTRFMRITVVAVATIALSQTAFGGALWNGNWALNLAKSRFNTGVPPKSQTLTSWVAGNGIRVTFDTVDAEGNSSHSEYVFNPTVPNDVRWIGNSSADTASVTTNPGGYSYQVIGKKDGKPTITS